MQSLNYSLTTIPTFEKVFLLIVDFQEKINQGVFCLIQINVYPGPCLQGGSGSAKHQGAQAQGADL